MTLQSEEDKRWRLFDTDQNSGKNCNFKGMEFKDMTVESLLEKRDGSETIMDTNLEFEKYQFKVLELRTIEDYKDKNEINKCQVRFTFTHRLLKDSGNKESENI